MSKKKQKTRNTIDLSDAAAEEKPSAPSIAKKRKAHVAEKTTHLKENIEATSYDTLVAAQDSKQEEAPTQATLLSTCHLMLPSDTAKTQRTFLIQLHLESGTLSDLRVAVANALGQHAAKIANMRFITASGRDVTQHEKLAHSIQPNSVITIIARARGGTKEPQQSQSPPGKPRNTSEESEPDTYSNQEPLAAGQKLQQKERTRD